MNRWILRILGLGILVIVLLVGLKRETRAQQGEERGPGLDQLVNLTSYQGLEEMPYFGDIPAEDEMSPSAPEVNVPGSQIVFQSYRNLKDWNIYISDGSGGSQAQVTGKGNQDIHPGLNRGCTRVVYASKRGANYHIFTINPDGSGEKQLTTDKSDDVYPAWSPDGIRIVFQAYRDGNPEIYIMNADGTGQTRLTWHPGYDGTPSWSPDGSKIIFASDRIGYGGIWVMNPDSSGLTQLSGIRYSYFPHWSPDGSRIAFSADEDNNGWLELWVMNSDGSNPGRAYNPGTNKDALAGSWSPDGHYASFTGITYINYRGNWYWSSAYLMTWEPPYNQISKIMDNSTEWNPDWQTNDILAPTSSMQSLPEQSPGPFSVSWSGYDNGSAGIKNYDVQAKEAGGDWTDWMMATTATAASYPGVGGHTYFFRVRARDNAFNTEPWPSDYQAITTVESYPPNSRVQPLPIYTRNGTAITWTGTDTGGSGIQTYDVQYRDASGGGWVDWQAATPLTEALFAGTPGNTYFFRSRAIDNASNQEAWPAGDGDAQTMLYTWGISGKVTDNTGLPVTGASITTTPGAYHAAPSDLLGFYRQIVIDNVASYQAFWNKDGYGALPTTTYGVEKDAQANIVLPPLDNIIQNSGFESGNAGWIFSGDYTPVISYSVSHTGNNTAILGIPGNGWDDRETIVDKSGSSFQLGFDNAGNVYAVWTRSDMHPPQVQFAIRDIDGTWSDPVSIATNAAEVNMVVEPDGTVHVIYNNGDLMYTWRNQYDEWSTPVSISAPYVSPSMVSFVRDSSGILHVAWNGRMTSSSDTDFFYNHRELDGTWGTPYVMNDTYDTWLANMAVDGDGNAHFVWKISLPESDSLDLFYMERYSNGTWSTPQDISGMPGWPKMAVAENGMVHIFWIAVSNLHGYYTYKDLAGNWSTPEEIPGGNIWGDNNYYYTIQVTRNGQVYILWNRTIGEKQDIYFLTRAANGSWSKPEKVIGDVTDFFSWNIQPVALDSHGRFHVVWIAGSPYTKLYYAVRDTDGNWSTTIILSDISENKVNLFIDQWDQLHVIWDSNKIVYRQTQTILAAGDSTLTQPITIPMQLTSPILSFVYRFDQLYTPPGAGFEVSIKDGPTATPLLQTSAATLDWIHAWFDLSPWAGKTIELIFNVHQAAHYSTVGVFLDEVTLGSAHPDVWVSSLGGRAAMPGETVKLQLTYGNRSPAVEALSATITATLPAGLIFESASLTPAMNGNVLTWSVGDLPAGSGPFTILVTATLAGDAVLGSTLTLPVEVSTITPELEQANNQDDYVLYIGCLVYLPVTIR